MSDPLARRRRPRTSSTARAVLDSVSLIQIATATFEAAARIDPPTLRSLDALHIAVALGLGDDLEGFVTYDDRLADAAAVNGIHVFAPR